MFLLKKCVAISSRLDTLSFSFETTLQHFAAPLSPFAQLPFCTEPGLLFKDFLFRMHLGLFFEDYSCNFVPTCCLVIYRWKLFVRMSFPPLSKFKVLFLSTRTAFGNCSPSLSFRTAFWKFACMILSWTVVWNLSLRTLLQYLAFPLSLHFQSWGCQGLLSLLAWLLQLVNIELWFILFG